MSAIKTYRCLSLALALIISVMGMFGFNRSFAWTTHKRGKIIDSGYYADPKTYVMEATGQEYNYFQENGGDWQCDDLEGPSHAIRLSDARVAYFFKVPQELYDHRLIYKIQIEIKYDRTDYADSKYGNEDLPLKFYVRDFQNAEYDEKGTFPNNVANNDYKYKSVTLYSVYTDQSQYNIGSPNGDDPYEIHVRIYAPDGYGPMDTDDDAEIDIDYVRVYLYLKQQHPPQLQLISPDKGSNDKVNVPLSPEGVLFTIEADDLSDLGYPIRKYCWKKQPETDPEPSFSDITEETTEPNRNFSFNESASNYKIYCYVLYKKDSGSTEMKDTITSEILEIPVRVWNPPTVSETPPQSCLLYPSPSPRD